MADPKTPDPAATPPDPPVAPAPQITQAQISEAQRTSNALAEAMDEAERRQPDEFPQTNGKQTDSGMAYGKFIVNGQKVYADGTPVKG